MNIKANMRVDFDSFKNTTTVATGWVEIEGIFKFPVSVRKWLDDKSGKEMMFVSYPQRKMETSIQVWYIRMTGRSGMR